MTPTGGPRPAVTVVAVDRMRDARATHRLSLTSASAPAELSTLVPAMESHGLTVVDAAVRPGDGAAFRHELQVRADRGLPQAADLDGPGQAERLAEAVGAALTGVTEVDSLNRLVLAAGLSWRDVMLLRAYRQFRRQVGAQFTPQLVDDVMVAHPAAAAALVDLVAARLGPGPDDGQTGATQAGARDRLDRALSAIERFDDDRVLTDLAALVDATLRTNRWAPGPQARWTDGHPAALALKFASRHVPDAPPPVPWAEIFVTAPGLQGVHLRGGPVARGGIRLSDRREDVRGEVLALMRAQVLKNALIVPTGAKGGFVLTGPASSREAVREAYATFIRALLEVTDDVLGDRVVAPPGVRRRDGDDAYLVVAADKGTAGLSDLANEVAASKAGSERTFWLGDAFASGGSSGYDHKEMGITARGAWAAVRRHFRELDVDVQDQPVTVAGVGDMSGDVFGNALLLSRSVRLVAAFDHRHVFVDPDPDPATSWGERARLASLPSSSWADYDPALLSEGGGVHPRDARVVPLSPQARAVLALEDAHPSPLQVVRAVLSAPVDLLFFGGVGTFVRAPDETDAQVSDRANDAVRVTAADLRARVVGEGANLALTQRARIRYARRGGRCNTDAVDNAAGVATSDREVNLKILLDVAVAAGDLERGQRDAELDAVRDEVAVSVVYDVDRQAALLGREAAESAGRLSAVETLMAEAEAAGRLDRAVQALPDTDELARRRASGAGLARPEAAVLVAVAKVDLKARLLSSPLPDRRWLRPVLDGYLPSRVRTRFGHLLPRHRLYRELVATVLSNDVVDRMGATYVSRTANELGCMAYEVAEAWQAAREACGAEQRWRTIEASAGTLVPALETELTDDVDGLVDAVARRYLRPSGGDVTPGTTEDVPADRYARIVERDRGVFAALGRAAASQMGLATIDGDPGAVLAASRVGERDEAKVRRWIGLGVDEGLAADVGALATTGHAPDVAAVTATTGRPLPFVAAAFVALAEALPLHDLVERVQATASQSSWGQRHQQGLLDDLRDAWRDGALSAVRTALDDEVTAGGTDPGAAERPVARLLAARSEACARVGRLLADMDEEVETDGEAAGEAAEAEALARLARLASAVRALRVALAPPGVATRPPQR